MARFGALLSVVISAFGLVLALPPVIFAPGYGGSELYGFINYEVPEACGTDHTHSLTHSLFYFVANALPLKVT